MLTRRSFLYASSAAAITNVLREGKALKGAKPVRYNAASPEGKAMLLIYAQGVWAMKSLPSQDPRSWTFQWFIHATPQAKAQLLNAVYPGGKGATFRVASATWFTCQTHQGESEDLFLPWHRMYLMQFEQIIRSLTGHDEFAMPYWDYTSPASYAIPEEFQSKNSKDPLLSWLYVANRNKDGGQLRAADVNAGEPINKHFRGRRNFLVLPNYKERDFKAFSAQLNSHLHGAVHTYSGDERNMGNVPTAAGDPLFWIHHSNVDRVWAAWNASGGVNPTRAKGGAWAETKFLFPNAAGEPEPISIASIADPATLPYEYDELPGVQLGAVAAADEPQRNVLMRSLLPDAEPAAPGKASAPSASVPLGSGAAKVKLAPMDAKDNLRALSPDLLTGEASRIYLVLKDVRSQVNPNTTYQVFLDLPENASTETADDHYVGLLNFFGLTTAQGQEGRPGRDVEYDVTDLVRGLKAASALPDETSITLVPVGKPDDAALPTIHGGIELLKR